MENYQNEDGTIEIPEVLKKYMQVEFLNIIEEVSIKTKLYLDIDGVLLGQISRNDPTIVLAKHINGFLEFSNLHFDCHWLTTHCKDSNIDNVIKYLSKYSDASTIEYFHKIKPTKWDTLKTEAIDFNSDFFWIDDAPLSIEKEILKKHNKLKNLIQINTRKNEDDLLNEHQKIITKINQKSESNLL